MGKHAGWVALGLVVSSLTLVGCSSDAPTAVTTTTVGNGPKATFPVGAVKIASLHVGDVMVDGSSLTLYIDTKDTPTTPDCVDDCLKTWPPFVATVTPVAPLAAADFATFTRPDGTKQVTYKGHQLYHYSADGSDGSINGQGLLNKWYVVDRAGNAVK